MDKSRIEINPLRNFRYVANATRYACGSICFCIPRQRRDMSKARGIYLISNWSEATIYRVRAKREHIESTKLIYRQKKNKSKNRRIFPFTLALSASNMGLGEVALQLLPFLYLTGQMRCSQLTAIFKFSAKSITPLPSSFFSIQELIR